MSPRQRWLAWLVGTPLLIPLQFFLLRPSLYRAAFKVRNNDWVTRDLT